MTNTDSNLFSSPVMTSLTTDTSTDFIVDDAELLSILASNEHYQNHAENLFETPPVAILDWEDWNQDVPEFVNNKRKRSDGDLVDSDEDDDDDDDDDDEFNFLDQFDFVDVSFDHPPLSESNKKQKITNTTTTTTTNNNNANFVDESADDLSNLLKQSDSFIAELDCGWVLDIIS